MLIEMPEVKTINLDNGYAKVKLDHFNQRIKIVRLQGNLQELIERLVTYAHYHSLGKIFYIAKSDEVDDMKKEGFIIEAKIDHYSNGQPGYFVSKFLKNERKMSLTLPEEEEVLIRSREYIDDSYKEETYKNYFIRDASKEDSLQLAHLYDSVFETYPSPMNDPEFIQFAMDHHVFFKVAVFEGKIVSAASADMEPDDLNAEMTDCATYKSHRGKGLMGRLIYELEQELRNRNYQVLYSTARAISTGMNIVFAKHNYEYGGRLVNHCHICGQFENMNIWVKIL